MADRHGVADMDVVPRRKQMDKNALFHMRQISALLHVGFVAAELWEPFLPMRLGVTPDCRIVVTINRSLDQRLANCVFAAQIFLNQPRVAPFHGQRARPLIETTGEVQLVLAPG